MNAIQLKFLLSRDGIKALQEAKTLKGSDMKISTTLRKTFSADIAIAIMQQLEFRNKGKNKFQESDTMLFTRDGLEQATCHEVAKYHSKLFDKNNPIFELCCGIGGDLTSFVKDFSDITIVDTDNIHLELANYNGLCYNKNAKITLINSKVEDVKIPSNGQIFCDPQRRKGNKRNQRSHEEWSPPLSFLTNLAKEGYKTIVKCSPAIDLNSIPEIFSHREFVSLNGELKELFIAANTNLEAGIFSTVLPLEATNKGSSITPKISKPQTWLHEPDAALIRSGSMNSLAEENNLFIVAENIAYMTSKSAISTELFSSYKVINQGSFTLKNLQKWCKEYSIKILTIKKRGFPEEPETILKKLKLKGTKKYCCFLYRQGKNHDMVLTEEKNR